MSTLNGKRDIGLLILRLVFGLTMISFHGIPKILGGPENWEKLGKAMGNLGINFFPVFWGGAAAIVETVCAILIIIGLWTRPSSLLLVITMIIAAVFHLSKGDGLNGASHAIEFAAVFIALYFTGPGRYSIDKK